MPTLAIDQGTTSTRALVVDEGGSASITKVCTHHQHYPAPGWVEHEPEELIGHLRLCIDENPGVSAIGIDNQGESCMAWDAISKLPVSRVIVWQDNRTRPEIEKLKSDGVEKEIMDRSGLPLDAYFSASKLAWILRNIPAARSLHKRGKLRLGTTDAYFLDRLAGRFVTDITTASRTSLLNLETGRWDQTLCDLFNVPMQALPEIVPTVGDLGEIESNGLHIPVTASIVDQQASLYGHGCRRRGDAKITFGTGAFALVLTGDEPYRAPEQGLLPTVAWQFGGMPPEYALDGGVYCAGSAVEWARKLGLFDSYEEINRYTAGSAIERDLVFVPALSGLACPHWDRRAAGLWLGLSLDTGPADMMQALLEGVAFRAAEVISAVSRFTRVGDNLSVDGGVSANPYFCQFLSNVLNRQVNVQQFQELTALGTARLAGAANLVAVDGHAAVVSYKPQADMRHHVEKFSEAVERAKKWKSA